MTSNGKASVRRANAADAPGIARVHVDTWRTAYKGIIPEDFLAGLSPDRRQPSWERSLASESEFVFVAEAEPGRIIGFASGGPTRNPELPYQGELYAIYVLDSHQGMGTGRDLMLAVVEELARRGMNSMLLWVLSENASARRFYEKMGGQFIEERQFDLGGAVLDEAGYGWPDTTILRGSNL